MKRLIYSSSCYVHSRSQLGRVLRSMSLSICFIFGWLQTQNLSAQELEANVSINAQQLEAAYRERFETLQTDLTEFINNRAWTETQFAPVEKIGCTFAFIISAMPSSDRYQASLTVQSRRPVYNSNYHSTLLNHKDSEVEFDFTEGQTLNFNEFNPMESELVAVVTYYIYLILGLDFDSFSPKGGEVYLRKAENIVSQMQGSDSKGWKAFDSKRNRHAIITDLLAEPHADYRQLWYDYHRLGLDAMHQSVDKGRSQVNSACQFLQSVKSATPQSILLTLFIDAKIDELINVYSKAPQSEKNETFTFLRDLFPTYTNRLNEIKKVVK